MQILAVDAKQFFQSGTTQGWQRSPCASAHQQQPCENGYPTTNMKIPKATHSCQPMTSPPRMDAGEFSAAKTGIVDALVPIPIPSSRRQANSCGHVWVKAEPMTDRQQNIAEKKMVPRRPKRWFNGWDNQQPLHRKND